MPPRSGGNLRLPPSAMKWDGCCEAGRRRDQHWGRPVGVVLPTSMSASSTRAVFLDEARQARVLPLDELNSVAVEQLHPVREFFAWQGQRSYQGEWWSSTTHRLLPFESLLEREALTFYDFDQRSVGLSVQPFAFLWARAAAGPRHHVPDVFVRLADGRGCLVDVRPAAHAAQGRDQFDRSAAACAEIGWTYVLYTGLPEPLRSNLRFVAGFRADRFALHDDVVARILEACTPEGSFLRDILDEAVRVACSAPRALAGIYHML